MRLRFLSYVSCVLFASAATMQAAFGQFEAPHTTKFTLTSPTQIPALELKPGTYSISIVDHLPDRTVLRIEGAKDDVRTMVRAQAVKRVGMQFVERMPWIGRFNIMYALGIDGLSLWFVPLTAFITVIVVISAWQVIEPELAP